MVASSGALRRWWDRLRARDPYWEAFLHQPPADPRNVITPAILRGPTGTVYPSQTDIHDPAAMSGHIKELAKFLGADATGIAVERADNGVEQTRPYSISCVVAGVEEPDAASGIGGQFAFQKCATVNFNLAAYIRELGFSADVLTEGAPSRAVAAGLGTLDAEGRLVSHAFGRRAAVAGAIRTDLPLVPDTPAVTA